jgi:hypothetical protein
VNFKVCDVWQKGICKLYLLHWSVFLHICFNLD